MGGLKKTTRAELGVVANLEANLEIVLGVRRGDLDPVVGEGGLLLELKDLAQLLCAGARLEEA